MISIAAYYIQTLLPVTLVLLAALFLFLVFIRKSASTKHFLSAAGICLRATHQPGSAASSDGPSSASATGLPPSPEHTRVDDF